MVLTLIRPTGSTLVCTLPPGNIVAGIMPDGAVAYPAYGSVLVCGGLISVRFWLSWRSSLPLYRQGTAVNRWRVNDTPRNDRNHRL